MIKFLISIFIITTFISCKEIQKNSITSKLNIGINKIEKVIEKNENKKNNNEINISNNNDSIFYYIGEPYFIEGVKYVPEENYNYSEIGIASFYGKELHNVKTINNDINKVTELLGRHKTLPIPSMTKITNLDNGLSINIKIIDRHNDNTSVVQVSRKVAQLLGFYKDKIATVRVEVLPDSSKQWKNVSMSLNEPEFNETISSAPTEIVSISDIDNLNTNADNNNLDYSEPIELNTEQVDDYKLFLKVYNFNNYADIQSIILSMPMNIKHTSEKNNQNYDLILGPIEKNEINNLVSYFISKGYKETKILLN